MLTLSRAAAAIGGSVRGPDVIFTSVTTDSRNAAGGALFVALKGARFDGHDFVAAALAAGAAAALVAESALEDPSGSLAGEKASGRSLLVVPDTLKALGQLGAYWRSQFAIPVVGVTGSNGKTTVKEMVAAILRHACGAPDSAGDDSPVLVTQGNLNNDIGMPLTLLRLRSHHRYAVIEMGMNHPGEISYLTRLARPTVAAVNNAQAAHLAGLKTVGEVARAKGEIFEGLQTDGVAVINRDDPHNDLWQTLAAPRRVIDFGLEHPAAVRGASYRLGVYESEGRVETPYGELTLVLRVPGMHNLRNALAATAIAIGLSVPGESIVAGLMGFSGVKGRLQKKACHGGAVLIDDTYNANPDSVRAAIAVLAGTPGRKVFVLGDMGELGPEGAAFHQSIGSLARDAGIDSLLALGDLSRHAVEAFGPAARHYERIQELLADLENMLTPDVTVLVKGSRFMQMERVVKSFEIQGDGK